MKNKEFILIGDTLYRKSEILYISKCKFDNIWYYQITLSDGQTHRAYFDIKDKDAEIHKQVKSLYE